MSESIPFFLFVAAYAVILGGAFSVVGAPVLQITYRIATKTKLGFGQAWITVFAGAVLTIVVGALLVWLLRHDPEQSAPLQSLVYLLVGILIFGAEFSLRLRMPIRHAMLLALGMNVLLCLFIIAGVLLLSGIRTTP